jgi:hypothetical protein
VDDANRNRLGCVERGRDLPRVLVDRSQGLVSVQMLAARD